jgi:DNA-binding MarR family transcriptional regulator
MTSTRAPDQGKSPRMATGRRVDEVEAAFLGQYPAYQYNLVEFLTGHLVDVSREFGGDLQQMLLMAVIGQVHIHRMLTQPEPPVADAEPASISASRLADVTGIPRQTVRRKLAALAARGWIEQNGSAAWRLSLVDGDAPARCDLADIDRRAIRRAAGLFANLEALAPPASGKTAKM